MNKDPRIESRVERLNQLVSEGRIIRNGWFRTDAQGRETACLLAALSPEAGNAENPDFCPAEVMPAWLAHLTPWLDDACSDAEWPRVVRRYAACAARWSALDDAAWRRVEVAARRASVVEAMSHTTDEQVLDTCRGVLVWLDADMPESSRAAVKSVAKEAWVATAARASAKEAADAAAEAVAAAAVCAADAAAAVARASAVAAAWAADASAMAEAADRITEKILSALEQECGL